MSLPEPCSGVKTASVPLTPLQRRCAAQSTAFPDLDVRAAACPLCGAAFLNNGPGRDAHRVVFGHAPIREGDE